MVFERGDIFLLCTDGLNEGLYDEQLVETLRAKNDFAQHLVAFDPANGDILWHAGLADDLSNGPETYLLDGQQYVVAGAGDSLYCFTVEP